MTPPDGLDPLARTLLSRLGDSYVRSAKIVDDEEGYERLVTLVQAWRIRYPLVDGRGNFGSADGDLPAGAMYTQVRLAPLAHELGRFPNGLVNGMPPHNLREAIAAVLAFMEGREPSLPGPDFPTGGVIVGGVGDLYTTGRGAFRLRARTCIDGGAIAITELPYGVAKGGDDGVITEIIEVLIDRPELADLADRSDRNGMRLILVLAPDADPHAALSELYAKTSLEIAITVEMPPLHELIEEFAATADPEQLRAIADRYGDDRRTSLST